jgi:CheY-like chemotaxis protein
MMAGGQIASAIGTTDWSGTPLGPARAWPPSLRSAVELCLAARNPAFVWWGTERAMVFNDAAAIVAPLHARALGQPAMVVWPERWEQIGPMVDRVWRNGAETVSSQQTFLVADGSGAERERHFTFNYLPIPSQTESVEGVFGLATETTAVVVLERRLRLLDFISQQTAGAINETDACQRAAAAIDAFASEIPFAFVYLADENGTTLRLAATSGLIERSQAVPESIPLVGGTSAWNLESVFGGTQPFAIVNLTGRNAPVLGDVAFRPLPASAYTRAIVGRGPTACIGCLVAGLNPQRVFDADTRAFLDLTADRIGRAVIHAQLFGVNLHRAHVWPAKAEDAFLKKICHELRTPLHVILGWAEVLEQQAVEPASRAKGIAAIRRSALIQKQFLEDLMESRVSPAMPVLSDRADDGDWDPPTMSGLLVLIVDDDPDGRELSGHILSGSGAQIVFADSAEGGLEQVRRRHPDLIVSDIGLTGPDGYAFMRMVRALPEDAGGKIPAVAVTAFSAAADRYRALRAGYQMHIAKPVESRELLTVCASLTGRLG